VGVPNKRIRSFQAAEKGAVLGRQQGSGPVGPVDVKPKPGGGRPIGRLFEVVIAAGGRRAGVGDEGERSPAALPGLGQGRLETGGGHVEFFVDIDGNDRLLAQPHDRGRPPDGVMALGGSQNRQGSRARRAVPPDIAFGRGLPGGQQRGQVAARSAAREDAVRAGPESGQSGHPADEMPFHGRVDRAHFVDGRAVVE